MKPPVKLAPDVFAEAVVRAKAGLAKPKQRGSPRIVGRSTRKSAPQPRPEPEQAAQLNLNTDRSIA